MCISKTEAKVLTCPKVQKTAAQVTLARLLFLKFNNYFT